jgi:capsular exopolysaccharide synthesis family protein
MTLTQYLRVLRQQWLVVALLAVLGLGGAAAYTYRQVPIYSAQTQLFISVRSQQTDVSELSQGSTFTQQRVKSYADLVTSPMITRQVITDLRLPYSPEQLAGEISASSPLDTVLLEISVADTNPTRAAAIANAVGREFPDFVATLENPGSQGASPVKVSTTRQAEVPTAPVSPRIPLNLALGLIVGLGLGVGAAVLRDQFNTTVSGVGDVERLTGAIPLGVVPYDATAAKQPLVTDDQFGGRAEAFRTLRTNLQFADVDDPPRVITITSALPAEGKTTTACNIALTLAQSGARVVLVEGDLRKPAVGRYLGISNAAGLTNVLAGQHELRDVIVGYQRDALAVLPSGPTPPNPSEMLGSQQMRQLLTSLANHYDLVIIDAPPLLPVTDAAVLAAASDGAIVVVRHGKSRREEVERAVQALTSVNAKVLGTVLNFAPRSKGRGGYDGYGYGYGQPPKPEPEPRNSSSRRRKRKQAAAKIAGPVPLSRPGSVELPPARIDIPPARIDLPPLEVPQPEPAPAGADWAPPPPPSWPPPNDGNGVRLLQDESQGEVAQAAGTGIPRHHRSKRSL